MGWGILPRRPDFAIGRKGEWYMRRWHILPRNRWFNVYLHNVLRDDDPRALHDHPWWNMSIVLWQGYWEVMPPYRPLYPDLSLDTFQEPGLRHKWRRPGTVVMRRATDAHRLALDNGKPAWSLFITGRNVRAWGFWCRSGWRHWEDFVRKTADGNEVGAGCDT